MRSGTSDRLSEYRFFSYENFLELQSNICIFPICLEYFVRLAQMAMHGWRAFRNALSNASLAD